MTINQTPASTSDARKRRAEHEFLHATIGEQPVKFQDTDQPPVLPDTSTWVRRAPGDVIEAGTPYAWRDSLGHVGFSDGDRHQVGVHNLAMWTPPPASPEPWERISTDRERPTLARVTFATGLEVVGNWVRNADEYIHLVGDTGSYRDLARVTSVELLHTHSPDTHVPVERALIDEAASWRDHERDAGQGHRSGYEILLSLAALADGAQS